MVETIAPVVHGDRRGKWVGLVAIHALGTTLASTGIGAAFGALGAFSGAPWGIVGLVAIAVVAGIYLLREGVGVPVPLPDRGAQVPEWWRSFYSPPVAALLYGLGLGVGFLTFLGAGTYVVVSLIALVSADPLTGALVCAPFGLARGLAPGLVRHRLAGGDAVDRIERWADARVPGRLNAVTLISLLAASIWGAVTLV